MHIPDGILPVGVCAAGYASTAALTWYALRKINQQDNPRQAVPRASLLTAAFFVASWIHIPIPPASVHLVLNGLLGVLLGYYAFPAILVGLFLQAVMFQHGGLTTLGVNATMMGLPALLAAWLFRLRMPLKLTGRTGTAIAGFIAGAVGLGMSTLIFYTLIVTTLPATIDATAERVALTALLLAHVPLMILEGFFTLLLVLFLYRVRPEVMGGILSPPVVAPD